MASPKIKFTATIVISLFIGGIVAIIGYHYLWGYQNVSPTQAAEKKVLFWYDPMHPNTKFDNPGKSPFMDMDLVPKYADDDSDDSEGNLGIIINPTLTQNLGLKTAPAILGKLDYSANVPATISFNEHQFIIVQSRADGFIDNAYPLTVGDKVSQGEPLMDITIPEWVDAQSEYLLLVNTGASKIQLQGVLERLRLTGMPDEEIQLFIKTKKVKTHFQIKAPMSGVITAYDLKTGMNITKDKVIAQIQGVDPIWVNAAIPESLTYLMTDKAKFKLSVPAFPNRTFTIDDWTILPTLDANTRSLQVRFTLNNKEMYLKPGMNAYLSIQAQSDDMILIPSQAVIDTGNEQRVITLDQNGRFVPKQIKVFHESGNDTAVISGLSVDEKVVTSGLFLIDSEANISGALERMRQNANESSDESHAEQSTEHADH